MDLIGKCSKNYVFGLLLFAYSFIGNSVAQTRITTDTLNVNKLARINAKMGVKNEFVVGSTVPIAIGPISNPKFAVIDSTTSGATYNIFKSSNKNNFTVLIGPGNQCLSYIKSKDTLGTTTYSDKWQILYDTLTNNLRFRNSAFRPVVNINQNGRLDVGKLDNNNINTVAGSFSHDISSGVSLPNPNYSSVNIQLMVRKDAGDSSIAKLEGFVDGSFGNSGLRFITQKTRTDTIAMTIRSSRDVFIRKNLTIGKMNDSIVQFPANLEVEGNISGPTVPWVVNIKNTTTNGGNGHAFIMVRPENRGKYGGVIFPCEDPNDPYTTFNAVNGLIYQRDTINGGKLRLRTGGISNGVESSVTLYGKDSILIYSSDKISFNSNRVVIGPKSGNGHINHPLRIQTDPVLNISSLESQHSGGNAFIRIDAPDGHYSGLDFGTTYLTQTSNDMRNVAGLVCHNLGTHDRVKLSLQAQFGYVAINEDGNVKIAPADSIEMVATKVAINGNLQVNGDLKIKTWTLREAPDYVFHDSYNLAPLDTVEKFVKVNKHLPDVPSAKTMSEDGVDLVKMNMIMLKKVEELTLYMIDQQKQIKGQQEEIDRLKKKMR